LARDDDGGAPLSTGLGGCSRIGPVTDLPAGQYLIEVQGTPGPYALLVLIHAAGCGNGLVELNEACDDGNRTDGDGCSAACAFEPIVAPGRTVIVDVGDHRAPSRTMAIDLRAGGSLTVQTDTGVVCELDLFLALRDSSGRMIAEDVGPGCPALSSSVLGAGQYVLEVGNRGGGQGGFVAVRSSITLPGR
jgi:cysteine-rich repeat protein